MTAEFCGPTKSIYIYIKIHNMLKFKFFNEEEKTFSSFVEIYDYFNSRNEYGAQMIAQQFLSDPIEDVIAEFMGDWDEDIIQQFRDWRVYNGDWWQDDAEVVRCMEGMESAAAPAEHLPQSRTHLSRFLMNLDSFSLEQKCENLKTELLQQCFMDRVKQHFIIKPDGVEVVTYFE